MGFLDRLISPARKAEHAFERARDAEMRGDFAKAEEQFSTASRAFDEHLAEAGADAKPSRLVMAGISYVRMGRDRDALNTLQRCLSLKDIPDAFAHAGYAAAKLGLAREAAAFWEAYPKWAEQPVTAQALREQAELIRESESPDLQACCEAVAKAMHQQDRRNRQSRPFRRGRQRVPRNRGY
ncbi:hypothetical protein [Pseudodesulfovibrio tunisiensis]|uniref:hypothetical protein n=1 Tax=Pseudodesulfovibrio tunisiensis TaxID=463192 RepID=UPI001FB35434|nr:hypothetical protein [Pseudodesulfovibrio tunisiensis]